MIDLEEQACDLSYFFSLLKQCGVSDKSNAESVHIAPLKRPILTSSPTKCEKDKSRSSWIWTDLVINYPIAMLVRSSGYS